MRSLLIVVLSWLMLGQRCLFFFFAAGVGLAYGVSWHTFCALVPVILGEQAYPLAKMFHCAPIIRRAFEELGGFHCASRFDTADEASLLSLISLEHQTHSTLAAVVPRAKDGTPRFVISTFQTDKAQVAQVLPGAFAYLLPGGAALVFIQGVPADLPNIYGILRFLLLHELGHCSSGGKIFRDVRMVSSPVILLLVSLLCFSFGEPISNMLIFATAWLTSAALWKFAYGKPLETELAADIFAVAHSQEGDLLLVKSYLERYVTAFHDARLGDRNEVRRKALLKFIAMRMANGDRFSKEWAWRQIFLQTPLLPSMFNVVALALILWQSVWLGASIGSLVMWRLAVTIVVMTVVFVVIYVGGFGRACANLSMQTGLDIEGIVNSSAWRRFRTLKVADREE